MFLGRLEFVAVLVLVAYLLSFRPARRTAAKRSARSAR